MNELNAARMHTKTAERGIRTKSRDRAQQKWDTELKCIPLVVQLELLGFHRNAA